MSKKLRKKVKQTLYVVFFSYDGSICGEVFTSKDSAQCYIEHYLHTVPEIDHMKMLKCELDNGVKVLAEHIGYDKLLSILSQKAGHKLS